MFPTPGHYNDVEVEVDESAKAMLLEAGLDELLAKHVAHLFASFPRSHHRSRFDTNV